MKDLGHGFSLAEKNIYHYDSKTFTNLRKIIDYKSFELIDNYRDKTFYFKDKEHVYVSSYMCTPSVVEGADPAHFKIINGEEGIGFDGNNYYWYDKTLPYDYSNAQKYNEYYLREGNGVFFLIQPVEDADADSFSIIWQNIGRDKNNLFFKGVKEDVDVNSFKMVPGCFDTFHLDQSHTYYASDASNVYFVNTLGKSLKKLNGVKPEEFSVKVIDERLYGICGNNFYFFGVRKKGVL